MNLLPISSVFATLEAREELCLSCLSLVFSHTVLPTSRQVSPSNADINELYIRVMSTSVVVCRVSCLLVNADIGELPQIVLQPRQRLHTVLARVDRHSRGLQVTDRRVGQFDTRRVGRLGGQSRLQQAVVLLQRVAVDLCTPIKT